MAVENWNFYDKAIYLGLMVRRLLLAEQGIVHADDRDYYGNKRMQLAGDLIALLFEEHFKNFNEDLKRTLMKKKDKTRTRPLDILRFLNFEKICTFDLAYRYVFRGMHRNAPIKIN